MASDVCRLCLRSCPNTRSAFDDEQILKDVFPFWKDFEWCIPVLVCPECKTTIGTFHSFSARVHSNIVWQTSQIELVAVKDEGHSADETETPELLAENSEEPVTGNSKENIYDEIDIEKQELPELSDDENQEPAAELSNSDTWQNPLMEIDTENWDSPETEEEECKEQDTCESTSSNSTIDRTANSTHNSMFLPECWIVLEKLPAAIVSSIAPPSRKIKMLICHVCNRGFNSSNALYAHKIRNHPPNDKLIHRCKYCSKKFSREYMLTDHLFAHRIKKCRYCNESYGGAVTYKQHLLEKHEGGKFKCNICSNRFKRMRALSNHLLSHGENSPKSICKVCGKEFDNINAFRCHMNYLHGNNSFECAYCGMHIKGKSSLERHIMRRHNNKRIRQSES